MTPGPDFSIVIPVHDDLPGLQRTIHSLRHYFPEGVPETIVCIDGGCAQTCDWLDASAPTITKVVLPQRRGSYAARNAGIRQAASPYIAFIDAGVTIADSWRKSITEAIAGEHDYCAGYIDVYANDETDIYQRYEMEFAFPVDEYLDEYRFCPTANLLVKTSLLERLGLFDERLYSSGDREFGNRVFRAGYQQQRFPGMRVYHDARDRDAQILKSIRILDGHQEIAQHYPEYFEPVTIPGELCELARFATGKIFGRPLKHIGRSGAFRIRCELTGIKIRQILSYSRRTTDRLLDYNRV